MSNDQYSRICEIVETNLNVLNPSYILKSHKPGSFLTFILKEIYEYINMRAPDGTLILDLKKQRQELRRIKDGIGKLNTIIKSSVNAS